jgi:hypothetical protein
VGESSLSVRLIMSLQPRRWRIAADIAPSADLREDLTIDVQDPGLREKERLTDVYKIRLGRH